MCERRIELIPLFYLMDEFSIECIKSSFLKFICRDEGITNFLNKKAIEFEKAGKAKTFLFLELNVKKNKMDEFKIVGFFSLALQVLDVPETMSNRKRKHYDGAYSKKDGNPINTYPVYLIGQLARHSNCSSEVLPGHKILEEALGVITNVAESVGGRIVLVECTKELRQFYKNENFEEIDLSCPTNGLIKMIKFLNDYEVE